MSRAKIGLTLHYILDQREAVDLEPDAKRLGRKARAELRALESVARTVETLLARHREIVKASEYTDRGIMSAWVEAELGKASARLARASGRGTRGHE